MSSILTNTGSMTALQTLRAINTDLAAVRVEIATGRSASSARENGAFWAVSKGMEADAAGFRQISDSLALGDSTVAVARQGAETIAALLGDMKSLVVAAQGENVDRTKIQTNIAKLREQIDGIVGMASFNGQNLLKNTERASGTGQIAILASLDRSASGIRASDIEIRRRDLGTAQSSIAATGGSYSAGMVSATLDADRSVTLDAAAVPVAAGDAFSLSIFGTDGDGSAFDPAMLNTSAGAGQTQAEMAASDITYVARDGDTMGDVAGALARKFAGWAAGTGLSPDVLSLTAAGSTLRATSRRTDGTDTIALALNRLDADAGNAIGGGLDTLNALDVTTTPGARAALGQIEGLIGTALDVAAAFGSDQRRIETQSGFVTQMAGSLTTGIGQMVDSDLIETSARLRALEVQQQLAVTALSIANTAPQVILSLFR